MGNGTLDLNNFPPKSNLKPEDRLALARGVIARRSPFFGTIVFGFPAKCAPDRTQTMAVDHNYMYYNPVYVMGLDMPELCYELCHEAMHPVLDHIRRMKGRDHKIANKAADLVLDEILVDGLDKNFFRLPFWCHLMRDITAKGGHTMEGTYDVLKRMEKSGGGASDALASLGGRMSDDMIPGQGEQSPEQAAVIEQKMKGLLVQAVNAQKSSGIGQMSGGLMELVNDILHPKVRWEVLLRRFMKSKFSGQGERTWSRPNRRSVALGFPLPYTRPKPSMGPLIVITDRSGSMGQERLDKIQGELNGVSDDTHPESTWVIQFTSRVETVDHFPKGSKIKLPQCQTGGTDVVPAFQEASKLPIKPQVALVFTDMEFYSFPETPPYPVLWIVVGGNKKSYDVPFGEVIVAEGL